MPAVMLAISVLVLLSSMAVLAVSLVTTRKFLNALTQVSTRKLRMPPIKPNVNGSAVTPSGLPRNG